MRINLSDDVIRDMPLATGYSYWSIADTEVEASSSASVRSASRSFTLQAALGFTPSEGWATFRPRRQR